VATGKTHLSYSNIAATTTTTTVIVVIVIKDTAVNSTLVASLSS